MRALAYASFLIAGVFAALLVASIVVGDAGVDLGAAMLALVPLVAGLVFLALDRRVTSTVATPLRVTAFVVGVLLVVGGLFWVSYVGEYGGGHNWMTEATDGQVQVYEVFEETGTRTLVFTGTQAEADRWMDRQREAASDTTWPWATVGVGGLVLAGSVALGWRRTDGETAHEPTGRHVTA